MLPDFLLCVQYGINIKHFHTLMWHMTSEFQNILNRFFFSGTFLPTSIFRGLRFLETPTKISPGNFFSLGPRPKPEPPRRSSELTLRCSWRKLMMQNDDVPPRWGPRTLGFLGGGASSWSGGGAGGEILACCAWWCAKKLNWIISSTVRWCFKRNISRGSGGGVDISTVCLINMTALWRLCKIYLMDDHEQRNSAGRFYLKMPWFSHTYHTHPYAASGQRDVRFLTDFPFLMEGLMSTEPIFNCLAGELETSPQIKTPPITKF